MKNRTLLLALFLLPLMATAQNRDRNLDRDPSEVRDVRDFTAIQAELAADIYIRQADTFSLVAYGHSDQLEKLKTTVRGAVLYIDLRTKWHDLDNVRKVRIYITVPTLSKISFEGAGKVVIEDKFETPKLEIDIEGAHNLTAMKLKVESLHIALDGVGNIEVGGKAQFAKLILNGTGNIDAYDLQAFDARCVLNGLGRLDCFVNNNLDAEVSGLGSVYFAGEPKNIRKSVNGIGKIKPR